MRPIATLCTPLFVVLATLLLSSACSSSRPLVARLDVDPPKKELRDQQTEAWHQEVKAKGAPGHWLVIRGYHETDNFIVTMTNTPISHAAVLDLANDQVVESTSDGVHLTPLDKFLHNSHRVLIIEPRWWTPARGDAAAAEAVSLDGSGYDYTGLVGLSKSDRFYCSELAFHVYNDFHEKKDYVPRVIEPGQMYLYGRVLWDSGVRDSAAPLSANAWSEVSAQTSGECAAREKSPELQSTPLDEAQPADASETAPPTPEPIEAGPETTPPASEPIEDALSS